MEKNKGVECIQELLVHNGSKTTEIYTHILKKAIEKIRNPIDDFFEMDYFIV